MFVQLSEMMKIDSVESGGGRRGAENEEQIGQAATDPASDSLATVCTAHRHATAEQYARALDAAELRGSPNLPFVDRVFAAVRRSAQPDPGRFAPAFTRYVCAASNEGGRGGFHSAQRGNDHRHRAHHEAEDVLPCDLRPQSRLLCSWLHPIGERRVQSVGKQSRSSSGEHGDAVPKVLQPSVHAGGSGGDGERGAEEGRGSGVQGSDEAPSCAVERKDGAAA